MRIAFLTPEFVTEKKFDGGLANYLQRTAIALKQAGHAPEIFVATDRTEEIDFKGIPVHRVMTYGRYDKLIIRVVRKVLGGSWNATMDVLCISRALSRRFKECHLQRPFDVVQAADFQATGLAVPLLKECPLITRLSYFRPALRKAYDQPATIYTSSVERLESRSIRRSSFVYAPSVMLAKLVENTLGLPVDVVYPSAYAEIVPEEEDVSIYNANFKGKRYVLFFGRICRAKGVYTLAKAMAIVLDAEPDVWCVLAGREEMPGIVAELKGIAGAAAVKRMIHLQRLPHGQLYPIIRHAECVCLPSRIDNFPNTCIEAMCLGSIVIGTRGTGFEDLIQDGKSGLLVEKDNPQVLAQVLRSVLAMSREQREQMRQAALRRVGDFSPSLMIPELVAYYQRCVDAHRAKFGDARGLLS